MSVTVIRQAGCRVNVRSATPSQVKVRGNSRKIIHVSAGVAPIRTAA